MRNVTAYLLIRVDGTLRVVTGKRGVSPGLDEIAVPIHVSIPDGWRKISQEQSIAIQMPDPPTVEQGPPLVGDGRET